ncbi:fe-s oxidoreductase [hydrocarbon metagenome]|uniref:Fe-s oxidoreductase n=1 Tax=hydrocarbon metagenome TaxID=938273 RepID=A0A0W8FDV4_9ZZZZ
MEYVPTGEVIAALDTCLSASPALDYITFAGSGEPTLHSRIGEIIAFVKERYPEYRIAVLTNGSLLSDRRVRDAVLSSDLILPSMDAASEEIFRQINRPCAELTCAAVLSGLRALAEEYSGEILLEIFIVPGLNDSPEELALLREAVDSIEPVRVQINTLDRPGVEAWVRPASPASLEGIAALFGAPDGAEVIVPAAARESTAGFRQDIPATILATLARRPCTADDLSQIAGVHRNEISKYLLVLQEEGRIEAVREKRGIFFRLT